MFKQLRMIAPLSVRYTRSHPRACVAEFASFGSALRPVGFAKPHYLPFIQLAHSLSEGRHRLSGL
jgi:hypothetical protein